MLGPFWTLATSFVYGAGAAAGIALINSVGNLGGFVGPYGIGYLRDATDSYSAGLIAIGIIVLLGGALVLTVPDGQRGGDTAQNPRHLRSVGAVLRLRGRL